jgi:hypothetical protein
MVAFVVMMVMEIMMMMMMVVAYCLLKRQRDLINLLAFRRAARERLHAQT